MDILKTAIEIIIIVIAIDWLFQFYFSILTIRKVKTISSIKPGKRKDWPSVSVIIPASNEESEIEASMDVRLTEDYPDLEFILINDRSLDSTGKIMDEIARIDERVKVVHIRELPKCWLGKLNAMNEGYKKSKGEWLLFSDADVHWKAGTLKRVIHYAEKHSIDHLVVAPELWGKNFLLDAVYCVFERLISLLFKAWKLDDKKSKAAGGAGAFNLVKRSALDASRGIEWLKMEVVDDVALGAMLKESGAKSAILSGRGYVGLHFYNSIPEMAKGIERATFTAMGNFSFFRIFMLSLLLLLEISPMAVFFVNFGTAVLIAGIAGVALSIISHIIYGWSFKCPLFASFIWPLGSALIIFMTIRAGILGKVRGGIYWRGTFYSEDDLKSGKRLYF